MACKPDSVPLGAVIIHLRPPLPTAFPGRLRIRRATYPGTRAGRPRSLPQTLARPLGLAPGGVCRAATVTSRAVVSYTRRFTLTRTCTPCGEGVRAVCSLWHCPAGRPGWVLPTTCPVESGLSSTLARRDHPANSSNATFYVRRARTARAPRPGRQSPAAGIARRPGPGRPRPPVPPPLPAGWTRRPCPVGGRPGR